MSYPLLAAQLPVAVTCVLMYKQKPVQGNLTADVLDNK